MSKTFFKIVVDIVILIILIFTIITIIIIVMKAAMLSYNYVSYYYQCVCFTIFISFVCGL